MKEKLTHFWAALCLFTRLPLWRIWSAPAEAYPHAIHYWMVAGGLLTSATSATLFFGLYPWLPVSLTVLVYVVGSLFLTGAFHEDGLADFFDGFGGGTSRERILEIMKDSHIGTYGVLALISYFLLLFVSIGEWASDFMGLYRASWACVLVMVTTSVWSRCVAMIIPSVLPYARTAETAKVKMLYAPWTPYVFVFQGVVALLALVVFTWCFPYNMSGLFLWFLAPMGVAALLYRVMKKGIGGYTGDCCGATVLLCELSMHFTMAALAYYHITF